MSVIYVCGECGRRSDAAGTCDQDGRALGATTDLLLGSDVGRYRLTRVLGEGGMGRVYAAVHAGAGSRVAIKVIAERYAHDRPVLDRFFAEARAVNLIRHESIVNVIDLGELADGRPYIVMELVEGKTLRELIQPRPDELLRGGAQAVPLGGLVQLTIEALSALGAAHAIGIVHRDLKPDNILVTTSGRAKVLDFGVAKLSAAIPGVMRTQAGIVLGTPEYMAPEQATGGELDARCDVYAVGVMLYEAVTGRRPFDGLPLEVMKAHLERAPIPPRQLRPDLPEVLEAVILRALAKRPSDRFPTARAMAKALRRACGALGGPEWRALASRTRWLAPAPPPPRLESSPGRPPRAPVELGSPRRRVGLAIAAIAGVIVLGAAVGLAIRSAGEHTAVDAGLATADRSTGGGSPRTDVAAERLTRLRELERRRDQTERARNAADRPADPSPQDPARPADPAPPDPPRPGADPAGADPASQPVDASFPDDDQPMLAQRIDTRGFDPVAFIPAARDLAARIEPGVELVELDAVEVAPDGSLTISDVACIYTFRSSSKPPTRFGESRCGVRVTIGPRQAVAQRIGWLSCDEPTVRAPRCSVAETRRRVETSKPARVSWRAELWAVATDQLRNVIKLRDDCR